MKQKTKLIHGWGINDVAYAVSKYTTVQGNKKKVWVCPYYQSWKSMISRCYSIKYQKKHQTYRGCTVCEEWRHLSNFIKWVDSQPNRDWQNSQLDKDLLFEGNKMYSPSTVVYISSNINTFSLDCGKTRGNLLVGVHLSNSEICPYKTECRNPFTGKKDYLGVFSNEMEAHLAWRAKKHEHACKLADIQQDVRVANALREKYATKISTV